MASASGSLRHTTRHACTQVVEQEPQFRPAWVKAAWVAKELGDIDRAVACLEAALRLDPDDPHALMYLADTLNNRKQWQRAVELYTRAIALDKRNPDLRLHLGDTLMNLGRTQEALREYRRGLRFSPNQPELLAAHVQASQAVCRWRDWQKYLRRCLAAYVAPRDARVCDWMCGAGAGCVAAGGAWCAWLRMPTWANVPCAAQYHGHHHLWQPQPAVAVPCASSATAAVAAPQHRDVVGGRAGDAGASGGTVGAPAVAAGATARLHSARRPSTAHRLPQPPL